MNALWTVILCIVGLLDASYIYYKKKKHEKMSCLIGSDCTKVVNSAYATTFGIDNTIMGMAYYAFLLLALLVAPYFGISSTLVTFGILLAAILAALASAYLLFIQLFVLKDWCDYCLLAAVINILIAVVLFL